MLIRLSEADMQRSRNPFDSENTFIGVEETDCIGEDCGERIFLSEEDQGKYGCPTSQKPMEPHYHIVVHGSNPPAGPWHYAVFSK